MKTGRKLLSFLLTLAMVVGLMPGMSLMAYAASTTVTWNASDIVPEHPWDEFFTKDGITITAASCDFDQISFWGGGTFTTTLGNFTKIEISADYAGEVSGTGWSNDGWQSATWTGDAASVSFSGDIWGGGMTCDGGNLTIVFTIATVPVTGVTLDKTDAQTIDVGGKVAFTATVAPDGATDKTVKWSVGGTNASAVTLYSDSNCTQAVGADATSTLTVYAKGISAGSATVTATSNADSEKKASCDVTVNAAAPAPEPEPESTYTLTIPSALNVTGSGWTATDGISATGTLASGKKLTVTAVSTNSWALKSGDNSVSYTLTTAEGGSQTTSWEFDSLSSTATTKPLGIIVEDYSSKPAGTYQDTVTFTASVEDARQLHSLTLTGPYSGATLVMEYYEGDTWNDMADKYSTYIKIYSGYAAFYTDGFIYDNGRMVSATAQIDSNKTYEVQ